MVGEIRDKETAEIAIQASLTGHLVFSTVHTNDAAGAVTRLVDMGVEPFLVASSLTAILAQRLVRRVCPDCREQYTPTDEELQGARRSPARRSRSATAWTHDLQGRRAATPATATATAAAPASTSCCWWTTTSASWCSRTWTPAPSRRPRCSKGMLTLLDDGARKVALGETTIAEVLSVTQEDI